MKKEDLKIGKKLQNRIENIDARIDRLKGKIIARAGD